MNMFFRELKAHRIGLIAWSVGLGIFMWTSMVKFQALSADTSATNALLKQMPDSIKAIFGMNGLEATTLSGYFGICFLFILILLAVHAAQLGSGLLTAEPLNKTTEFLYTRPVSRRRIVSSKLLAGLLQVLILWVVTFAASWGSIALYASMNGFETTLTVFMLATGIIQLTCFSLGMLAAAVVRSASMAGKLVTAFVFASYALSLVSQLDGYNWLRYASIFRYFDAVDIIATHSLKIEYVIACLVVSIVAIAAVYVYYPRRDLTS